MSERPVTDKLREALYREVPLREERLESERRRLLKALESPALPMKRASRVPVVLAAVAALVLAAVGAGMLFTGEDSPVTTNAPQTIAGLRWLKYAPLPDGVELRTPPETGAKLVAADGTTMWVDRESSVLSRKNGGAGVELRRGNLLVDVRRRAGNDPFIVQTPAGEVIVHGTVFSVRLRGDHVLVRLYRGAVSLKNAKGETALRPGFALQVGASGVEREEELDRAAIIADLLIAETTADLGGPKVPVLELPAVSEAKKVVPSVEEKIPVPGAPPKTPNGSRRKPVEAPAPAVTEPSAPPAVPVPAPLSDPELAGIHVEQQEAPKAAPPPEEDLMDKALGEIRDGHHENGRTLLKQYLFKFPEGRYVEPVEEILAH